MRVALLPNFQHLFSFSATGVALLSGWHMVLKYAVLALSKHPFHLVRDVAIHPKMAAKRQRLPERVALLHVFVNLSIAYARNVRRQEKFLEQVPHLPPFGSERFSAGAS